MSSAIDCKLDSLGGALGGGATGGGNDASGAGDAAAGGRPLLLLEAGAGGTAVEDTAGGAAEGANTIGVGVGSGCTGGCETAAPALTNTARQTWLSNGGRPTLPSARKIGEALTVVELARLS